MGRESDAQRGYVGIFRSMISITSASGYPTRCGHRVFWPGYIKILATWDAVNASYTLLSCGGLIEPNLL